MHSNIQLSIVIPAWNEEKSILKTLKSVVAYLEKQTYFYEIVVVDDGSTDKTIEIVKNFQKRAKNVRLLSYSENRGKGYAVRCGMLHTVGDYSIYIDADGAVSIDHLKDCWDEIENGYDIAIGSTELKGTKRLDDNAWYRKILGKMSKYLIRFMATPGIHDTQRAFKLFRRVAVQDIFKRQTIEGWGFDIEILVIARKLKYSIKEVPVTWLNPKGSRQEGLKTYALTLLELFDISTKSVLGFYKRNSYPTIPTLEDIETTLQGRDITTIN